MCKTRLVLSKFQHGIVTSIHGVGRNFQGICLRSCIGNTRIHLTRSYFYCDEKVILQIIYTTSGSELPESPTPALVYTATSPLPASTVCDSICSCCNKSQYRDDPRRCLCLFRAKYHPTVDQDKHRIGINLSNDHHGSLVIVAWSFKR